MSTTPPPSSRDASVVPFLESIGLIAAIPPVRSSYYSSALSNPFFFYLTARLGLTSAFRDSDALSRGSWFHTAAETSDHDPLTHPIVYFDKLRDRQLSLKKLCSSMALSVERTSRILGREELDAHTAFAWWTAHLDVPLPSPFRSVRSFLAEPYWQSLGRELSVTCANPHDHRCPQRITIDQLLYHSGHHTLWLLDYKTTSLPPTLRMSVCPDDFQTQLYLDTTRSALQAGHLDSILTAASVARKDLKVAGMMHIAIQKPGIRFGESDRPYRTVEVTPTRGKNKGLTRLEREYLDEPPSLSNFTKRVRDHMTATGEYQHLASERSEPCVNISFTPSSSLEGPAFSAYNDRLRFLTEMLTRPAFPSAFLSNPSAYTHQGQLVPFAHFALCPVRDWPRIMSEHSLVVQRRDDTPPSEDPTDE